MTSISFTYPKLSSPLSSDGEEIVPRALPGFCSVKHRMLRSVTASSDIVFGQWTVRYAVQMSRTPRILVVEDDPEIRSLLKDYLHRQGLRVDVADGGGTFDRLMAQYGEPDLVVLDIMLPGEDGFSICRRLRATSRVPVIMLTARGDDIDRIVGLEMGADDYLPKPFNPRELLARIRAVLRRTAGPNAGAIKPSHAYHFSGWVLDLVRRELTSPVGAMVALTGAEYDLLIAFIERPGQVLNRDQLLELARNRIYGYDRSVDVQVSRLRRKLGDDTSPSPLIKTVRGAGYIFCADVERA
jgi:two-component system OmpR family response regulator